MAAMFFAALVFCCSTEPLAIDGWGHYFFRQHTPASWSDVWQQARDSYLYINPRLGQMITVVLYIDVVHLVLTPVVIGFVLLASCYLVAGRWPRLWRGEDWGLLALITALLLVLVANVGMMFFYRPYAGNYVYGFAFYLALLLPYRRALVAAPRPCAGALRSALAALAMLLLGLAAGLTNEHTGPAVVAGLVGFGGARRFYRRTSGVRLAPWMISGVLGVVLGYAALFWAPSQMVRYDGLGREPLTRWVLERGRGNATLLALGLAPLVPALAAWLVTREAPQGRRRWLVAFFLVVSALICATLLFSPKVGIRLFWPATVLQVIAMVSWFGPSLLAPLAHRWTARVCALVIAGHAVAFTLVYAERGAAQAERLRLLRTGRGTEVVLPCYQPRSQRWLVADDVTRPRTQQLWRDEFGVSGVRAEGPHCAR